MRRDPRTYLADVVEACERTLRFVEGRTYDDYLRDDLLRSAVERQFGIIGEAMSRLASAAPEIAERITDHQRVIAFRNTLIHNYDAVKHAIVWGVIESKIPVLHREAAALLEALDDAG
jgi:uncharacterized protein with HEPN domain